MARTKQTARKGKKGAGVIIKQQKEPDDEDNSDESEPIEKKQHEVYFNLPTNVQESDAIIKKFIKTIDDDWSNYGESATKFHFHDVKILNDYLLYWIHDETKKRTNIFPKLKYLCVPSQAYITHYAYNICGIVVDNSHKLSLERFHQISISHHDTKLKHSSDSTAFAVEIHQTEYGQKSLCNILMKMNIAIQSNIKSNEMFYSYDLDYKFTLNFSNLPNKHQLSRKQTIDLVWLDCEKDNCRDKLKELLVELYSIKGTEGIIFYDVNKTLLTDEQFKEILTSIVKEHQSEMEKNLRTKYPPDKTFTLMEQLSASHLVQRLMFCGEFLNKFQSQKCLLTTKENVKEKFMELCKTMDDKMYHLKSEFNLYKSIYTFDELLQELYFKRVEESLVNCRLLIFRLCEMGVWHYIKEPFSRSTLNFDSPDALKCQKFSNDLVIVQKAKFMMLIERIKDLKIMDCNWKNVYGIISNFKTFQDGGVNEVGLWSECLLRLNIVSPTPRKLVEYVEINDKILSSVVEEVSEKNDDSAFNSFYLPKSKKFIFSPVNQEIVDYYMGIKEEKSSKKISGTPIFLEYKRVWYLTLALTKLWKEITNIFVFSANGLISKGEDSDEKSITNVEIIYLCSTHLIFRIGCIDFGLQIKWDVGDIKSSIIHSDELILTCRTLNPNRTMQNSDTLDANFLQYFSSVIGEITTIISALLKDMELEEYYKEFGADIKFNNSIPFLTHQFKKDICQKCGINSVYHRIYFKSYLKINLPLRFTDEWIVRGHVVALPARVNSKLITHEQNKNTQMRISDASNVMDIYKPNAFSVNEPCSLHVRLNNYELRFVIGIQIENLKVSYSSTIKIIKIRIFFNQTNNNIIIVPIVDKDEQEGTIIASNIDLSSYVSYPAENETQPKKPVTKKEGGIANELEVVRKSVGTERAKLLEELQATRMSQLSSVKYTKNKQPNNKTASLPQKFEEEKVLKRRVKAKTLNTKMNEVEPPSYPTENNQLQKLNMFKIDETQQQKQQQNNFSFTKNKSFQPIQQEQMDEESYLSEDELDSDELDCNVREPHWKIIKSPAAKTSTNLRDGNMFMCSLLQVPDEKTKLFRPASIYSYVGFYLNNMPLGFFNLMELDSIVNKLNIGTTQQKMKIEKKDLEEQLPSLSITPFLISSTKNKSDFCIFSRNTEINLISREAKEIKNGMLLEAVDRLNVHLLCVATIINVERTIYGVKVRIHFDGWTDRFDYETNIDNLDLRPCGYHKNAENSQHRNLQSPKGYTGREFTWSNYFTEENRQPIPFHIFTKEQKGWMKVEDVPSESFSKIRLDILHQCENAELNSRVIWNQMVKLSCLDVERIFSSMQMNTGVRTLMLLPKNLNYDQLFIANQHVSISQMENLHMNYGNASPPCLLDYPSFSVDLMSLNAMDRFAITISHLYLISSKNEDILCSGLWHRLKSSSLFNFISEDYNEVTSSGIMKKILSNGLRKILIQIALHLSIGNISDTDQIINKFINISLPWTVWSNVEYLTNTTDSSISVSRGLLQNNFEKESNKILENVQQFHEKVKKHSTSSSFNNYFLGNEGINLESKEFLRNFTENYLEKLTTSIEVLSKFDENGRCYFQNEINGTNSIVSSIVDCLNSRNIITKIRFTNSNTAELQESDKKMLIKISKIYENLEELRLEKYDLKSLSMNLDQLSRLKSLHLTQSDIDEFSWKNEILEDLSLESNKLFTSISQSTFQLQNLKLLNLSGTAIKSISHEITSLENLEELQLNRLVHGALQLPSSLELMTKLKVLGLAGIPMIVDKDNDQSIFCETLKSHIVEFYENYLPLETIEKWISECIPADPRRLSKEEMSSFNSRIFYRFTRYGDGNIPKLPTTLFDLKNLTYLDLSYQAIFEITNEIKHLVNLEELLLAYCTILDEISSEIANLTKLKSVVLTGCMSLRTPPPEVASRGFVSIISYLKRLNTGSVDCKRTKLMLVGTGGAGKTSLVNAILSQSHAEYDYDHNSKPDVTDGIDIIKWKHPIQESFVPKVPKRRQSARARQHNEQQYIEYSIWDFAGQTVYYNTHQFFLSSRAVYLLVWNMRQGIENAGLKFWLSSISCHAPTAPIFIVGTHLDEVDKIVISEEVYKRSFPQISAFFYVSVMAMDHIDRLISTIIERSLEEQYMGEQIPEAWLLYEKNLMEISNQNIISLDTAKSIALDCGIVGHEEQMESIGFLHSLGSIQYFDNIYLKDKVVVNPQWIVKIMSCLVSVKQNPIVDGRLDHSLLEKIWKEDLCAKSLHEWVLHLTEKFDLTFPLKIENNKNKYNLVPCLLPDVHPENLLEEWNDQKRWNLPSITEIKLVFEFDHLPTGLFNRLQVRLFHLHSNDSPIIWKNGSLISHFPDKALIFQTNEQKIIIKVRGIRPENLLFSINDVMIILINEFNGVTYETFYPCTECVSENKGQKINEKENFTIDLDDMFSLSLVKRATDLQSGLLQCRKSFHIISIKDIRMNYLTDTNINMDDSFDYNLSELKLKEERSKFDVLIICTKSAMNKIQVATKCLEQITKKIWTRTLIKDVKNALAEEPFSAEIITLLCNAKMIVPIITEDFEKDALSELMINKLLALSKNHINKVLPLIYSENQEWKQTDFYFRVKDVKFIKMNKTKEEEKKDSLVQLETRTKEIIHEEEVVTEQDCFISYAWADVKMKNENLLNPLQIHKAIVENKISCWLDRIHLKNNVISDIRKGIDKCKLFIACLSDNYLKSDVCKNEFYYAIKNCKKDAAICFVGNESKRFRNSEINFLCGASKIPEFNFTVFNPIENLINHIHSTLKNHQAPNNIIPPTDNSNIYHQQTIEWIQRTFLKGLSSTKIRLPRLFLLDYLEEEKKFSFNILCEHEKNWHVVKKDDTRIMINEEMNEIKKFTVSYLYKILRICKHSDNFKSITSSTNIDEVFQELEKQITEHFSQSTSANVESKEPLLDLPNAYLKLLEIIDHKKIKINSLKECRTLDGKTLWLCMDHINETNASILTSATSTVINDSSIKLKNLFLKELDNFETLEPKQPLPVLKPQPKKNKPLPQIKRSANDNKNETSNKLSQSQLGDRTILSIVK
ncbi:hypothetical protein SNEBB_002052 [Seison nebaliae]|nr:hypothetical protein SNEBB_002052 [Seison nebaliae]